MAALLRFYFLRVVAAERQFPFVFTTFFLFRVVCIILVAHLFEMGVWGLAFHLLGMFPDLPTAYYFAIETYTTLGFGDVVPPREWRAASGWLAATGLLMFGWSTAIFANIIRRLNDGHMEAMKARQQARKDSAR
jgi:hypothetical protein